jgi:hypothetical protein
MTTTAESDNSVSSAEGEQRATSMAEIIEKGVKQSCMECLGETKPCRYCGITLNWLNGKPIELTPGKLHRCRGKAY